MSRVGPLVLILMFAFGCPQRWDPESPPGVSRGRSSAGEEGEAEGSTAEVVSLPHDAIHDGELAEGDHVLAVDNTLYDELAFSAVEGAAIVITMESAEFDPYLHLLGPEGRQLAHMGTPPGEDGNVAEVVIVAPETGEYRIYANALEPAMRGSYQLRVVIEPPPRDRPE